MVLVMSHSDAFGSRLFLFPRDAGQSVRISGCGRAYWVFQASCVGPAVDSFVIALPFLGFLSSGGLLEPYLDSAVSPARVASRQPTLWRSR